MRRKILLMGITILLIFTSMSPTYALETNYSFNPTDTAIIVPIYDSIEEMEKVEKENHIYSVYEVGGTTLCTIKPILVRTVGGCELYFDFDSTFQLSSVRFKELIVESEWIGKNYFKVGSANAKYTVKDLHYSLYRGRRLIYSSDDIKIPLDENRAIVRTKGLGVYRNDYSDWLSCQYQIDGRWEIN